MQVGQLVKENVVVTEPGVLTMAAMDHDGCTVLRLDGELDLVSAPQLDARLRQLIDAGSRRLVLDVADLGFCDSTGMALFVAVTRTCADAGGWLRLASPQRQVTRVLGVAGVLSALAAYRTVPAAVSHDAAFRVMG
jgi:anti-sigma B factor antagonist